MRGGSYRASFVIAGMGNGWRGSHVVVNQAKHLTPAPGYGRDEGCKRMEEMQVSWPGLLDSGLTLHLFRISVGAFEAHLLREGGAGRL